MTHHQKQQLLVEAARVSSHRREILFDREELTDLDGPVAFHIIQALAFMELAAHSFKLAASVEKK